MADTVLTKKTFDALVRLCLEDQIKRRVLRYIEDRGHLSEGDILTKANLLVDAFVGSGHLYNGTYEVVKDLIRSKFKQTTDGIGADCCDAYIEENIVSIAKTLSNDIVLFNREDNMEETKLVTKFLEETEKYNRCKRDFKDLINPAYSRAYDIFYGKVTSSDTLK